MEDAIQNSHPEGRGGEVSEGGLRPLCDRSKIKALTAVHQSGWRDLVRFRGKAVKRKVIHRRLKKSPGDVGTERSSFALNRYTRRAGTAGSRTTRPGSNHPIRKEREGSRHARTKKGPKSAAKVAVPPMHAQRGKGRRMGNSSGRNPI